MSSVNQEHSPLPPSPKSFGFLSDLNNRAIHHSKWHRSPSQNTLLLSAHRCRILKRRGVSLWQGFCTLCHSSTMCICGYLYLYEYVLVCICGFLMWYVKMAIIKTIYNISLWKNRHLHDSAYFFIVMLKLYAHLCVKCDISHYCNSQTSML